MAYTPQQRELWDTLADLVRQHSPKDVLEAMSDAFIHFDEPGEDIRRMERIGRAIERITAEQIGLQAMTRDDARAHWAASGLTYDVLTPDNMERLRQKIDKSLLASGLMDSTFRARETATINNAPGNHWADIRCSSFYFDDRQAVTFESNGFVGFAGWADDTNVQPILTAFTSWVDEMSEALALEPAA